MDVIWNPHDRLFKQLDRIRDVATFVTLFLVLAPNETPMKQRIKRFHPVK